MTLYIVLAAGAALLGAVLWAYASGGRAATAKAENQDAQAEADAAKRIAESQVDAPHTRDDLAQRLLDKGL